MQKQSQPTFFGVPWPGGDVVQFTKAEVSTLRRAAEILAILRSHWDEDDDESERLDVAMAMFTLNDLAEAGTFDVGTTERI